jgi:hypothetical protein
MQQSQDLPELTPEETANAIREGPSRELTPEQAIKRARRIKLEQQNRLAQQAQQAKPKPMFSMFSSSRPRSRGKTRGRTQRRGQQRD